MRSGAFEIGACGGVVCANKRDSEGDFNAIMPHLP